MAAHTSSQMAYKVNVGRRGRTMCAFPGRLELPTSRLTASRSCQLGYGSDGVLFVALTFWFVSFVIQLMRSLDAIKCARVKVNVAA